MRGLMQKFAAFMQGRYGSDKLNVFLYVMFLVLWIVNIFVFNPTASLILDVFEIAFVVISLFRTFSRNITKRSAENRKFLSVYNPVAAWFKLTFRKIKEFRNFRYVKCPMCKAQLRVKSEKGNHTVRCPKCGGKFSKKIRF